MGDADNMALATKRHKIHKRVLWFVVLWLFSVLVSQLCSEPRFCKAPISPDGFRRNLKHFSRFRFCEAAKKAKLDDITLSWVHFSQSQQSLMYSNEVVIHAHTGIHPFIQRNTIRASSAFLIPTRAGIIDKDLAHEPR